MAAQAQLQTHNQAHATCPHAKEVLSQVSALWHSKSVRWTCSRQQHQLISMSRNSNFPARKPRVCMHAIPPVCFNSACQAQVDQAFLFSVSIPIAMVLAIAAYVLSRPKEAGSFEDPSTGAVFTAPDGSTQPERDNKGQLAFRPISFTPWPVDESFEGERVRIAVGKVNQTELRTFVFNRLMSRPSDILVVTLPRPLGVVFEYDERFKRTVVADVVEGSNAEQQAKIANLNQAASSAVQPGDVLRAVTATNFVYPTRALFGAVPPERHIVLFGADKQAWANVRKALKMGTAKDGSVTMVLERVKPPAN